MAIRLPIDRSVVVTITREDQFPTTTGFNTALLLTPTALAGQVDATRRTKLYSNVYEVGLEWPTVSETYKAAARFFQAKVRPPQLKIGYYDPTADMAAQINLIYQADPDWFWLFHSNELNDKAAQRDLADWAESHEVILALDSNDTDTELPGSVDDVTFTATISQASPAVVTKTGHSLVNGDPVRFTTSGVLPAPLSITETYFVIGASANTFTVASTQGGPAIATTDAGTGTHTAISPRFGGSIAEYVENKAYDRTAVFYHTDPSSYLGAAAWGYACGRDLDRANFRLAAQGRIDSGQAYTLKFKNLPGVEPVNRGSAAVQAVTGFIPGIGSNREAGHRANTYVNMGGLNQLQEGTVGSGAFIDEIHSISWLKARTQESVFGVLSNAARVPYTVQGLAYLIEGGINPPMRRAFAAGIIAPQINDDGDLVPEFEVTADDPANVPVSQRRNRIAPDIQVVARLAGAIHFASVSMTLKY
jgi:hypothetical protein